MISLYQFLVTQKSGLLLAGVLLLSVLAGSQTTKVQLDASSDSLLLQGDPDLAFFRESSRHYPSGEFLILTWSPNGPLLANASLEPLSRMVAELERLPGVSAVTSMLDVPLLESPPLSLAALAESDSIPTLRDPVDRTLVLKEFTTSPIYRNLLVGEAGDLSAVQVSLESDQEMAELLLERESLRKRDAAGELDDEAKSALLAVERAYDLQLAEESTRRAELVAAVRGIADRYRPYAQIFVGGVPMIAADMLDFVRADLVTFGSAIIVIMMLVLAIIFRDWRWVFAPILNCSMTAVTMLGLLGFFDWRMTVISSNFVAVLLIVTLSLSVHLVVRFRELERTDPDLSNAQRSVRSAQLMFLPCLYTAITTIVAFGSLLVAGIQPVIDFGLMMTVGILVGFAYTFTLVPALMALLPSPEKQAVEQAEGGLTRQFAGVVERRGGMVLAVTALLAIATVVGISRLQVENRFIDYFKESTEIYQGMELLDAQLGGTIPLDIILYPPTPDAEPVTENVQLDLVVETSEAWADDDPFLDDPFGDGDAFGDDDGVNTSFWFTVQGRALLDKAHKIVDARTETGKVLSLSTAFEVMDRLYGAPLGAVEMALVQNSMPEAVDETLVRPYFSADNNEVRISVRAMETSPSLRRDQFLRELRDELIGQLELAPEQLRFTSLLVLYNNVLQSLFASQIMTLGAVFLAIGLMFWVVFRSLSLALLALAPNVLAAGMVLGIMGLLGIPLDIMTITIAAIVVGIGVDDCIHYIHRFRLEFDAVGNYREAMYRSHGSIGRAMYYTTLTVIVGFSLLTLSNFTPSLYFGLLTVVAMLAAVAGALLLLPRFLLLFKPLGPSRA